MDKKPIVKGPVDANVFGVIGVVVTTIRRAGYPVEAAECRKRCFAALNYGEVLIICQEYVEFDLG